MATVTNTPTEATTPQVDDLALLGLMQLVSPALPIGAFAWSQGLESAFELGWVNNEAELARWIEGVLEGSSDGDVVGIIDGINVGILDGVSDGKMEGLKEG